jgi:hypothetical protein
MRVAPKRCNKSSDANDTGVIVVVTTTSDSETPQASPPPPPPLDLRNVARRSCNKRRSFSFHLSKDKNCDATCQSHDSCPPSATMSIDFGALCRKKEAMPTQALNNDLFAISGVLVICPPRLMLPCTAPKSSAHCFFISKLRCGLLSPFSDFFFYHLRHRPGNGLCALAKMEYRGKGTWLAAVRLVHSVVVSGQHSRCASFCCENGSSLWCIRHSRARKSDTDPAASYAASNVF